MIKGSVDVFIKESGHHSVVSRRGEQATPLDCLTQWDPVSRPEVQLGHRLSKGIQNAFQSGNPSSAQAEFGRAILHLHIEIAVAGRWLVVTSGFPWQLPGRRV